MKTNEQPSDAAMQCAKEIREKCCFIDEDPKQLVDRASLHEGIAAETIDRAIAAAVAEATKELRDGLQTLAETSWTDTQDGSGDDLVVYRRFVKHSARALLQRHAPATSACPDAR